MNLRRRASQADVTIITGLSGAGRSEAAKALEDLGWFVIDNLPPALIKTVLSLAFAPGNDLKKVAVVIDARSGTFFAEATKELEKLRRDVCNYRLVFLEASDEVLVRRYEASRRLHPIGDSASIVDGITRERELLRGFREGADVVLDTTDMSVRDLRTRIAAFFEGDPAAEGLNTTVVSFGYKFGLPLDADLVLDVRFLPNPHWVEGLRELTGIDDKVRDYVLEKDETTLFVDRTRDLFSVLLPAFEKEGRHYLTVAIGCTGGRHRSVVLAESIATLIRDAGFRANVIHRDVDRPPVQP